MNNTTKRMRKIEDLTLLCGFSATELSRLSNKLLEQTYQASIPLIREKQAEIARVKAREDKHAIRKRELMARSQRSQQASLDWMINWKHPNEIPICTVKQVKARDEIVSLGNMAKEMEASRKEACALFRKTGDQSHADRANRARKLRDVYLESVEIMSNEA